MDDKQQGDAGFRGWLKKLEAWLRRVGGIYGGLRALAAAVALAAAAIFFALGWLGGDDGDRGSSDKTASSLDEYCERSARYAATWAEFQSSASRGELSPGDLGPAIDNIWSTHAVAPPELEDEYELLAATVEQLDEDLSGDVLSDSATFAALFLTNAPVLRAVDTIDQFDAEHCSEA